MRRVPKGTRAAVCFHNVNGPSGPRQRLNRPIRRTPVRGGGFHIFAMLPCRRDFWQIFLEPGFRSVPRMGPCTAEKGVD